MITAAEIRKKTERKYVDYLRSVVAGSEFEPIVIPCDKKASASMDEYQHELTDIRSQSKEVKGFGYTIEWKTVKTKALGEQDLPERVLFRSASDVERFLLKCHIFARMWRCCLMSFRSFVHGWNAIHLR